MSRSRTWWASASSPVGDSWWTAGSSGLTVPVLNPSAPAEASVTVEVSLAYAIADGTA